MNDSTQHRVGRNRPPRVQITYDLETAGASTLKSLPLVGGILADLSGSPEPALKKLKDRKFVEIDGGNFDEVLAKAAPRLSLSVPNQLVAEKDKKLNVELRFETMDDFGPLRIVERFEPLAKLHAQRQKLSDLLTKLDGNDELEEVLKKLAEDDKQIEAIQKLIEAEKPTPSPN